MSASSPFGRRREKIVYEEPKVVSLTPSFDTKTLQTDRLSPKEITPSENIEAESETKYSWGTKLKKPPDKYFELKEDKIVMPTSPEPVDPTHLIIDVARSKPKRIVRTFDLRPSEESQKRLDSIKEGVPVKGLTVRRFGVDYMPLVRKPKEIREGEKFVYGWSHKVFSDKEPKIVKIE